jgi:glycosyltransferase involved in cell wall biosynthesis
MRLLVHSSSCVYPFYEGSSHRTFHIVQHLAKKHALDLIQERWPWESNREPLSGIEQNSSWLERHFQHAWDVWHKPGEKLRFGMIWESPELFLKLDEVLGKTRYDVIWAPGEAFPLYLHRRNSLLPVLTGPTDSMHLQYRRSIATARNPITKLKAGVKWGLFLCYQLRILNRMRHLLVVADKDAHSLKRFSPKVDIHVVPNGVDVDYLSPPENNSRIPTRLVFLGTLGKDGANELSVIWFLRTVWPRIQKSHPEMSFEIIGPGPSDTLSGTVSACRNVRLLGYVEDIRPPLWRASAFILPMKSGAGIKNKLLEAWAAGCAVISTPLGVEGVPLARADENVLVASTPQEFAILVNHAVENPDGLRRIAQAGQETVHHHYRWARIADQLEQILIRIASEPSCKSH